MTSAARVSCGLYKMLLFTYPREFRQCRRESASDALL